MRSNSRHFVMTGSCSPSRRIHALLPLLLIACDPRSPEKAGHAVIPDGRGSIRARIDGIRNNQGRILARLYRGGEGFPSDGGRAYRERAFEIQDRKCTVRFDDIPYGHYALWICHDEDRDGELQTNFIGMPKEGVGVSGPPPTFMPSYDKARFTLDKPSSKHEIELKYL